MFLGQIAAANASAGLAAARAAAAPVMTGGTFFSNLGGALSTHAGTIIQTAGDLAGLKMQLESQRAMSRMTAAVTGEREARTVPGEPPRSDYYAARPQPSNFQRIGGAFAAPGLGGVAVALAIGVGAVVLLRK